MGLIGATIYSIVFSSMLASQYIWFAAGKGLVILIWLFWFGYSDLRVPITIAWDWSWWFWLSNLKIGVAANSFWEGLIFLLKDCCFVDLYWVDDPFSGWLFFWWLWFLISLLLWWVGALIEPDAWRFVGPGDHLTYFTDLWRFWGDSLLFFPLDSPLALIPFGWKWGIVVWPGSEILQSSMVSFTLNL